MSSLKKISAGVALALACAATVAQAAPLLTITPVYLETRQISPASNLTKVDLTNPMYSGTNYFHRFELMLSVSGLGAADDFGGATINVDLGTAFGAHSSSWSANNPIVTIVDDLGDPVQKPQFGTNGDPGADLQAITMLLESDVAFGTQFGEGAPMKVGTANVKWLSGTPAKLTLSPAAGNWLNLFVNNSGAPGGFATAFTSADANFASGEVQFGSSGPTPTFVAAAKIAGEPNDPNLPDVAFPYTGNALQYQPPIAVGAEKAEFQFPEMVSTPDGSLYAIFWLTGDADGIAAIKAEFPNQAEAGGPVEIVGPGPMFDSLMAAYPGANLILKYDGQANVLDGGSLAVDFSGNGVTIAQFAAVPEPASLLSLGGLSFLGFMLGRRRR